MMCAYIIGAWIMPFILRGQSIIIFSGVDPATDPNLYNKRRI